MSLKFSGASRNLISQQDAAVIANARIPRSKFHNLWTRKTAFNQGDLIPILVDEILPGDHMTYNVSAYVRMSTPLFPLFDNMRVDTFFFFVPNRLVWDFWVNFMGEQNQPSDSIAYTVPTVGSVAGGQGVGGIWDHMGIPVAGQVDPGVNLYVNVLPFRAYNLIWNQWFRDQNLQNSLTIPMGATDNTGNYSIQKRAKSHDYFTSALPWPQKFTAPTVPLGGMAPVKGIGFDSQNIGGASPPVWETDSAGTVGPWLASKYSNAPAGVDGPIYFKQKTTGNLGPDIYADLSVATGVAINTLRQAWMIQSLLERDAVGGTRYTEIVVSHFGVHNGDARLQRPEYIGGGQSPLNITPIAQTATGGAGLGALGAAGTSAGTHRATYAATEHGYVIGLINVRSELSYQQGVPRTFLRSTRYDYYWPALATLGEQAITRKEIYATGTPANDDVVFGYQERWHEYRTRYSEVTGRMRSTATTPLDAWHLAQRFTGAPVLNAAFIQDNAPMSRVLAAGSTATSNSQEFLADIEFRRTAVRPIPQFGTPVSLGRF